MGITKTEDSATIGSTEYDIVRDASYAAISLTAGPHRLVVELDADAVTATDTFVLRLRASVNADVAVVEEYYLSGPYTDHVRRDFGLVSDYAITLTKVSGNDRSIGWKLLKDDGSVSVDTAAVADAVWDELQAGHAIAGSFGAYLDAKVTEIRDALSLISVAGASTNIPFTSYVLTTGTQTVGTVANVTAQDATYHTHTDVAGAMNLYYEANIGAGGVPSTATWRGYLQSGNDSLEVYGYDWATSGWIRVGTIVGTAGATVQTLTFSLFSTMVGLGADAGKVRLRFTDGAFTLTSATFATDQLLATFTRGVEGYEGGAIWYDDENVNTNTVVGIDGTPQNPVSSFAALDALLTATRLHKVEVAPGSTLSPTGAQNGRVFSGVGWNLALSGRQYNDCTIIGAKISGNSSGSGNAFVACYYDAAVQLGPCRMSGCGLGAGTMTIASAGDYQLDDCRSRVPGASTPVIDFSAYGATNMGIRNYSGGISLQNLAVGDVVSVGGPDLGTVSVSGSGGSVDVRGSGKPVNDGSAGTVTIVQTGYISSLIPTASTVAAAVWGYVVEGTKTAAAFMRLFRSRLYGKATVPSDDGTYRYRDLADTKDRIVASKTGSARVITTEDGD